MCLRKLVNDERICFKRNWAPHSRPFTNWKYISLSAITPWPLKYQPLQSSFKTLHRHFNALILHLLISKFHRVMVTHVLLIFTSVPENSTPTTKNYYYSNSPKNFIIYTLYRTQQASLMVTDIRFIQSYTAWKEAGDVKLGCKLVCTDTSNRRQVKALILVCGLPELIPWSM